MPVLTAIDVLGVQRFVFMSNRLRDVVTGSYLVHWGTSEEGALKDLIPRDKILLAGGGNAIVETASMEEARSLAARYTRRLHEEAPGLEVALVHKEYAGGNLAGTLLGIQIELARSKTERLPSAPLLGLSVTETCRETGLPASGFDSADPATPLSKEILRRREKRDAASRHWISYLKDCEDCEEFAFPMELDDLGRTMGDTSLIGVVHVDGNSVGEKITKWLTEKSQNRANDDTVRREYREWSQAIDRLGKEALQAIIKRIRNCLNRTDKDGKDIMNISGRPAQLGFELKKVAGQWMLPLRPVLLGGDDMTFVCDGRIALDLTENALLVFEKSHIPHLGKMSACAGVAMVRVHAPFARAYELSEALCASAKRMLREKRDSGCALDWHIGTSRPGETEEGIRGRQYRANNLQLTCRPYRLGSGKEEPETWRWLSETLLDDAKSGLRRGAWSRRRNKVKALAELAREGPDSLRAAMNAWKVVDKDLHLPQPIEENGFFARTRTPLIDALELLDLHLVLDADEGNRAEEEKTL